MRKEQINLIVGIGVAILVFGSIQFAKARSYSPEEIAAALRRTSEDMNRSLPVNLDQDTRFETTFIQNNKMHFVYTLLKFKAEELDPNEVSRLMRPQLVHAYCTAPDMKQFVDLAVPAVTVYKGHDGQHVVSIVVTPADCR